MEGGEAYASDLADLVTLKFNADEVQSPPNGINVLL